MPRSSPDLETRVQLQGSIPKGPKIPCYGPGCFNYSLTLHTIQHHGQTPTSRPLPCSVCDVDSARAPQLDWTSVPRMVTSELPRFISAAFSGATWLNWTAERQPTKPCAAACDTFSSKFSLPGGGEEEKEVGVRKRIGRPLNHLPPSDLVLLLDIP